MAALRNVFRSSMFETVKILSPGFASIEEMESLSRSTASLITVLQTPNADLTLASLLVEAIVVAFVNYSSDHRANDDSHQYDGGDDEDDDAFPGCSPECLLLDRVDLAVAFEGVDCIHWNRVLRA
ncbi:hypothetical protein CsSME_00051920 [Camellia sinensis var. sinensis]